MVFEMLMETMSRRARSSSSKGPTRSTPTPSTPDREAPTASEWSPGTLCGPEASSERWPTRFECSWSEPFVRAFCRFGFGAPRRETRVPGYSFSVYFGFFPRVSRIPLEESARKKASGSFLAQDRTATRFQMTEVFSGIMLPLIARKLPDFGPIFERYAADLKAESEKVEPGSPTRAPKPCPSATTRARPEESGAPPRGQGDEGQAQRLGNRFHVSQVRRRCGRGRARPRRRR